MSNLYNIKFNCIKKNLSNTQKINIKEEKKIVLIFYRFTRKYYIQFLKYKTKLKSI